MTAPARRVTVRVPATSANVGVGFDCLGFALDLFATFAFEVADEFAITGCPEHFRGTDNLTWTTYLDAMRELGVEAPTLAIDIDSPIPLSGGLGSSSTCVVAGLVAAQVLAGRTVDPQLTVTMGTAVEGHPDNVAPAVLGGLVSSFVDGDQTVTVRYDVAPNLRFVVLSPSYEVRTKAAREVLPRDVALTDAVWQLGRCVAVTRAFETGDCELLAKACRDHLHEPYRSELIPDYPALREAALASGAATFLISGSGSSMVAICDGDDVAARVATAANDAVDGLWVRVMGASEKGMQVDVEA